MKQEHKELLLRDLCARLPYGIIVGTDKGKGHVCDINLTIFGTEIGVNINPTVRDTFSINDVKPYLFPLSSMTEEEWEDYQKIRMIDWVDVDINGTFINAGLIVDWLNAHHFDYRGLIPMDLAIDATGLNIY